MCSYQYIFRKKDTKKIPKHNRKRLRAEIQVFGKIESKSIFLDNTEKRENRAKEIKQKALINEKVNDILRKEMVKISLITLRKLRRNSHVQNYYSGSKCLRFTYLVLR